MGRRVIPERTIPHRHALTALQDHVDHRVRNRCQHVLRDIVLNHSHAKDARGLFLKVIGNAGDVDCIRAIVASEVETQGEKQIRGVVSLGLLDVDLHPGKDTDH